MNFDIVNAKSYLVTSKVLSQNVDWFSNYLRPDFAQKDVFSIFHVPVEMPKIYFIIIMLNFVCFILKYFEHPDKQNNIKTKKWPTIR